MEFAQLPCNSGVLLDHLEADTTIQQSIEALVELSNDSLDIIAWALTELLDRLVKVSRFFGLEFYLMPSDHRTSKPIPPVLSQSKFFSLSFLFSRSCL